MTAGVRFSLGTFAFDGEAAPYLVIDERAHDLRPLLGEEHHDPRPGRGLGRAPAGVAALADEGCAGVEALPLAELRPLPPVQPIGQIFQAAANYRQHVLDLIAGAESRGDDSDGHAQGSRDDARRLLDERAAEGRPFVFLGSAHAMVGAEDEIVLPADSDQSDWELELAAIIGRPGRRVPAGGGARPDRRLHDRQRPHLARRARALGRGDARHRLAGREERPHLPAGRPAARPGQVRRGPAGPAHQADRQRADDAGRVDRGHALRRRPADLLREHGDRAAARATSSSPAPPPATAPRTASSCRRAT